MITKDSLLEKIKYDSTEFLDSNSQRLNSQRFDLRDFAVKKLSSLNIPSARDEDWKYTNIKAFLPANLSLPELNTNGVEARPQISSYTDRIVFINGVFNSAGSNLSSDSIKILSSKDSLPEIFFNERFNRTPSSNEAPRRSSQSNSPFSLLNDVLAEEIVFIEVKSSSNVSLEISHISLPSKEGELRCPRLFAHVHDNAELNVIEHFSGLSELSSITNHVAEFILGENSKANHIRLQTEDANTIHLSSVYSEQAAKSTFKNINLQFGGKVSRNEIYPSLPATNSDAWLIGTNVINNAQHVDNFTVIDHIAPNCESHELYKGIYADDSKGVFSGTIIVQREAQKTNAYQSNASLLLSETSESSSKPQLKIWADDVKCSHGATVGQLDEEALFYLRARGITEKEAKAILTRAYVSDVLEHLEDETLKNSVENILEQKLAQIL